MHTQQDLFSPLAPDPVLSDVLVHLYQRGFVSSLSFSTTSPLPSVLAGRSAAWRNKGLIENHYDSTLLHCTNLARRVLRSIQLQNNPSTVLAAHILKSPGLFAPIRPCNATFLMHMERNYNNLVIILCFTGGTPQLQQDKGLVM